MLGVVTGCGPKKEESIVQAPTNSQAVKATSTARAMAPARPMPPASKPVETISGEYAELVENIRPDAERGDAESQYLLGVFYTSGSGVPLDYVEAFKWLQLAAAQDNKDAIKARDLVAKLLNREQRAEADKRVAAFTKSTTTARP